MTHAREAERQKLAPYLRHQPFCPGYMQRDGRDAMRICICGLRAALEPNK